VQITEFGRVQSAHYTDSPGEVGTPRVVRGTPPEKQVLDAGVALPVIAPLALTACGGGGSGTTDGSPLPIPPVAAITRQEAARFLQQASLNASDADIAAVQAAGFSTWLDQQFQVASGQSRYDWLVANGYDASTNQNSQAGMDNVLWHHLIGSGNGVRQRIALFWTEHFVVSVLGLPIPWRQFVAAAYMDLLEANCLGNFRDLLQAVTLSPGMGEYLNLKRSQKADAVTNRHPDENYAREVMQLFTIGLYQINMDGTLKLANGQPIATYTQDDVTGLAAAFTGWDFGATTTTTGYAQVPMIPVPANHQTTATSFLGVTVPAGTDTVSSLKIILDTLFAHPNLPPFVARRMIQRLVSSNPSPAYVGRVAAVFANDGTGVRGNLKAVVKAVLLDAEARQRATTAIGRVREPILRLIQWARTFKATSAGGTWAIGDTSDPNSRLGQSPLRAPSVFNFFAPDYTPPGTPLNAQGLLAPELQLVDESSVAGYLNYMQRVIASGAGDVVADYSAELAVAPDPAALLDRINVLMAAGQLSAATLATIQPVLASIPASTTVGALNRVGAAIFLVMASPEYQILA
jgi:uncharacterized protein (DUF1800 family)